MIVEKNNKKEIKDLNDDISKTRVEKVSIIALMGAFLSACGGGDAPIIPSIPGNPMIPTVPGNPMIPTVPGNPMIPTVPGNPMIPSNPNVPAPSVPEPINPVNPPAPSNPANPNVTNPDMPIIPPLPGEGVVPVGNSTTIYVRPNNALEASRFLHQATPGATKAEITSLQSTTYSDWINTQFNLPRSQSNTDWLSAKNYGRADLSGSMDGIDNTLWRKFISSPDGLRQRITLALSEIFVVAIDSLNQYYPQFSVGNFYDILEANAFGNYRNLLQDVTTSTAMGSYLTYSGSQLATDGSQPDENYAREIMQLFTIGLYRLNNDGSLMVSNGKPVPTYRQEDVSGLARVFTGAYPDESEGGKTPVASMKPMTIVTYWYENGVKSFLGVTIPAGSQTISDARKSIGIALDTLFNHPNVPPFIGKQLIQRLVTSNPSGAYINRVSQAFINNGSGVRGDMKAVIKAILLDDEARNVTFSNNGAYGKIREPLIRFLNWARAFGATSQSWDIGDLSSSAFSLGQSPAHSPSVFNFFRPGYVPSNSVLGKYNLTAPEFQITNESTVSGYVNFMQNAVSGQGVGSLRANYTSLVALSIDSLALINEIDLILGSQLSASTIDLIRTAIDSISATNTKGKNNRVYAALTLILSTPEYIAQK